MRRDARWKVSGAKLVAGFRSASKESDVAEVPRRSINPLYRMKMGRVEDILGFLTIEANAGAQVTLKFACRVVDEALAL